MKKFALLIQLGAIYVAVLSVVGSGELRAQVSTEQVPPKPASPEDLSQLELLRSYLQVREQLHATQIAIANNRAETEASARVQAAAITEKLEAIKSAMESERQRQQVETLRANAERERQQIEAQRSNRTVLWVSVGFGALGLLAMLLMPLAQWRTITRIAEITSQPRPAAPAPIGLLPGDTDGLSGPNITLSNQRLLSVIERMEKRIFELEQTTVSPLTEPAAPAAKGTNGAGAHASPASEKAVRISVLLGKGKFLLSTNKIREAVACYDEIIGLEADHAEALVKKGAALERLKQDDAAIKCYDRAIQANPKLTLAYLSKAGACNRLARYDEAMQCYEQALQTEEEAK